MTAIAVKNDRARRSGDEDMPFWASVAVAATLFVLCVLSAATMTPPLDPAPFDTTFVAP